MLVMIAAGWNLHTMMGVALFKRSIHMAAQELSDYC